MDTVLLLKRGVRRGLTSLSRDRGWVGGFLGIAGTLVLLQLAVIGLFGLQGALRLFTAGSVLRIEMLPTASQQRVQEFLVAARDLPVVERVEYVTKEQAYERERLRAPDIVGFLEEFSIGNPFPDTAAVSLRSFDDHSALSAFLREPKWQDVVSPSALTALGEQEREAQEMRGLVVSLRIAAAALTLFLIIVCLAYLTEFVRRRAALRKDEVLVAHVSGAPMLSILVPFATESSVLLILGCLLSLAVLVFAFSGLPIVLPDLAPGGLLDALQSETARLLILASLPLALLELLAMPVLSLFGSWIALRRMHV